MYASEPIQNCKNPTDHIDTLNITYNIFINHQTPFRSRQK